MSPAASGGVARAFGAANRLRLLGEYFQAAGPVTPANAWKHVYRLLLWIDPTTGLAHCYESDKSQPGRAWYARSPAFHGWVAQSLGTAPGDLPKEIGWLFTAAAQDLVAWVARNAQGRESRTAEQRAPYKGQGFPEPGEDPELAGIITRGLADYLSAPPPPSALNDIVWRVRAHASQENKRRNLVGEGFEDVLAEIIRRVVGEAVEVRARSPLATLPGFHSSPTGAKEHKVDLALIGSSIPRVLISVKWSIRADRERQFNEDFENYWKLNAARSS